MAFTRLLRPPQLLAALCAFVVLGVLTAATASASDEPLTPVAGAWTIYKSGTPPACDAGTAGAVYFDRRDCGFGRFRVTKVDVTKPNEPVNPSSVTVQFVDRAGTVLSQAPATRQTAGVTGNTSFSGSDWTFPIRPQENWPAGRIAVRAVADNVVAQGTGELYFQQLGASIAAETRASGYEPGDEIPLAGRLYEQDSVALDTVKTNVPAQYWLRVVTSDGGVRGPFGPYTADRGGPGLIAETLPADATSGLTAGPETNYETTVELEVVDAVYGDSVTGSWAGDPIPAGNVTLVDPPGHLVLENSFVSAVGWVKPGKTYPFRVFVKNLEEVARTGVAVAIPPIDGTTYTRVTTTTGSASIGPDGAISWAVGDVPARTDAGPGMGTLVVEARADTLGQDPEIVWKDVSTTATLTASGDPSVTVTSKGPKVIPPEAQFDTARYGFRPFPVVPVDYRDRKHDTSHSGERLLAVINSPDLSGSTYRLFQEMSYGQLHPHGAVPAASVASAPFDNSVWRSPHRNRTKFAGAFTTPMPGGACYGTTVGALAGQEGVYSERIKNGWYQLPGDTGYYGGDANSVANIGAPQTSFIDNACGKIAKAVYDSALIADPDINYSDYDTDKDGVVDFYMMVFVGAGGNGRSQLSVPPYDNIWPHSSSLEHYYKDPDTGQPGYVSDDQLEDNQGQPLYYTNANRGAMTTQPTDYPVYVRVGPYNVNPEAAIEKASVISHEYGHSLGLPDYYSSGSGRATYGDWNLMATDKSQHMDVNAKQELGWIVPRVLQPGQTTVTDWRDSKANTHRIDWVRPDGTSYTLSGPKVANGEAYVAKLPGRQILDPAKLTGGGATMSHVWWSQSGNDFNCTPIAGHNLDIDLSALQQVPAGTSVTLRFKSYWDIEWDFDYGFVMTSTNGGQSYESHASRRGFSTPREINPNHNACQETYGNGLTGTTAAYTAAPPTFVQDRNPAANHYETTGTFTTDEYDLSSLAGKNAVLRFSYATDPGLARPGWFIDDVEVTAGTQVIYSSDFEDGADEPAVYNGGCQDDLQVAMTCTAGWQYLAVGDPAVQDHAYYMEMRDRSGFDFNGKNQNDRAVIGFSPGLLLTYTDEAAGYGNTGESTSDAPNQSPLDSQPQPRVTTPNLDDAAFTGDPGKSWFSDSKIPATPAPTPPAKAQPSGWIDNYRNGVSHGTVPVVQDTNNPWVFDFGCLSFTVLRMAGDGIGPDTVPGDLNGDVAFTLGAGCAEYDYGTDTGRNRAPTAVAQVKPETADVGQPVVFDGSGSFDERQPANELSYAWDFDSDGTVDAEGQTVTHAFTSPGTYEATLRVTDGGGLSGTDSATVTVRGGGDLEVASMSAGNAKAKQGQRVTLTATIANTGAAEVGASRTEFVLDGSTVLGVVDTPPIPPGGSTDVSVAWDTRGVKGEHTIRATADADGAVAEANEGNNAGTLTVTVQGNKVKNGSFEQANASGTGPDGWSSSNGSGGTTSWSDAGTDGSKGASASGNGGSAAAGSPTWTSEPVAVVPGEVLDLNVAVNATGASSPASVSLVYLGVVGNVVDTVSALTAPTTTAGFAQLETSVTVPMGVASVRIVLQGFAPTDLATAGTVTFDDVGLFSR